MKSLETHVSEEEKTMNTKFTAMLGVDKKLKGIKSLLNRSTSTPGALFHTKSPMAKSKSKGTLQSRNFKVANTGTTKGDSGMTGKNISYTSFQGEKNRKEMNQGKRIYDISLLTIILQTSKLPHKTNQHPPKTPHSKT